jgi:hypothetical protein
MFRIRNREYIKLTVRKSIVFLSLNICKLLIAYKKYHTAETHWSRPLIFIVSSVYIWMYARKSFFVRVCVCQMIIQKNREKKKKKREREREREREYINIRMTSPVVANLRQLILPLLLFKEERHRVTIGNLYIQIHRNNMCVRVYIKWMERKRQMMM